MVCQEETIGLLQEAGRNNADQQKQTQKEPTLAKTFTLPKETLPLPNKIIDFTPYKEVNDLYHEKSQTAFVSKCLKQHVIVQKFTNRRRVKELKVKPVYVSCSSNVGSLGLVIFVHKPSCCMWINQDHAGYALGYLVDSNGNQTSQTVSGVPSTGTDNTMLIYSFVVKLLKHFHGEEGREMYNRAVQFFQGRTAIGYSSSKGTEFATNRYHIFHTIYLHIEKRPQNSR
jgi:hypothetical protein